MNEMVVKNVQKAYGGRTILQQIGFRLKRNEILGIFGRNGCGKSTLLQILYGTIKADELLVEFDARPYESDYGKWGKNTIIKQRLIGYLPQFSFLPAGMRVYNVIPLFYPGGEEQDRIFNAPRLARFSKKKVGELSIGERRYLEIQLVGNLDHPFLFLDEPFSMVEPLYAEVITQLLQVLKQRKGIIITDHYYEEVWKVATVKKVLVNARLHDVHEKEDLVRLGYLSTL
ncbi:MAG: ABC transporter ATP-binding protein [Cytophagaceae bacterium]|nr:ABC transporter ATP-binding protein [Cytophagaceae bacterium]